MGGYSEGGRRFSESASTSAVASPFPFPYPGPPTPEDEFDCSIFSTLTPALSFSNESFTSTSEAFVDSPPPLAQVSTDSPPSPRLLKLTLPFGDYRVLLHNGISGVSRNLIETIRVS